MTYADMMLGMRAPAAVSAALQLHRPAVTASATVILPLDDERQRLGVLAPGRPPSPFIGANTIVAMHWVMFSACVARWLVW